MSDATLFDAPAGRARAGDPDTSRAAAEAVSAGVEAAILATFRRFALAGEDGLTDDELCVTEACYRLHKPTVKSARSRLSKRGLLVDSGKRRPSDRGRAQIVWRLA